MSQINSVEEANVVANSRYNSHNDESIKVFCREPKIIGNKKFYPVSWEPMTSAPLDSHVHFIADNGKVIEILFKTKDREQEMLKQYDME